MKRHTRLALVTRALLSMSKPQSLSETLQIQHRIQNHSCKGYATAIDAAEDTQNAKPFASLPGPLKLPLIGSLYSVPYSLMRYRNSNDLMKKKFAKYGPIYCDQYGATEKDSMVHMCDVEDFEKLLRSDGLYPRRMIVDSWGEWRDHVGLSRGVLIQDGPDWKRMRVLLDKQMMRPHHVSSFTGSFGEVTLDFIDRLKQLRHNDTGAIDDMDKELFYWSLESIGTVLYETRLGGLSLNRTPETEQFVQAVQDMFNTSNQLFYLPRRLNKRFLPKSLEKHENGWEVIFTRGKEEIDKKCLEIQESLEKGHEVSGFLSSLLASGSMSIDEIYGNVSEFMAAAVDTTSNSMQWVLYMLSRNPDIQETLRDEVLSVAPRGSVPNYEQLQKMTYLKCVLKEVLRLYPVAPAFTRITNKDIVLGGYHIPPDIRIVGATYIVGRDPEHFPDPEKLIPERWMRNDEKKITHTFAWLPFGFGTRMCIGRRVAELELRLLIAALMQEFKVVPLEGENRPKTAPLLVPERPVYIGLKDRE